MFLTEIDVTHPLQFLSAIIWLYSYESYLYSFDIKFQSFAVDLKTFKFEQL